MNCAQRLKKPRSPCACQRVLVSAIRLRQAQPERCVVLAGSLLWPAERGLLPIQRSGGRSRGCVLLTAQAEPVEAGLCQPALDRPPALRRAGIIQEFHAKAQRARRGCADTNVFAPSCEDFAKTPLTLSLLRGLVPATRLRQAQPERRMVCHRFTARPERCAAGD